MKDRLNKPCRECPFKRKSFAGWLGSSTAKDFIRRVDGQAPMECHMTVDYSDPDWEESLETLEPSYCAGAAIYLNNSLSMPRDPEWAAVVKRLDQDKVNVFTWSSEFLAHHDNEKNRRLVELANQRMKKTGK